LLNIFSREKFSLALFFACWLISKASFSFSIIFLTAKARAWLSFGGTTNPVF
jgi:hypothetical protein